MWPAAGDFDRVAWTREIDDCLVAGAISIYGAYTKANRGAVSGKVLCSFSGSMTCAEFTLGSGETKIAATIYSPTGCANERRRTGRGLDSDS